MTATRISVSLPHAYATILALLASGAPTFGHTERVEVALWVGFAIVVVAVVWFQHVLKQRRRRAFRAFAAKAGLAFHPDDPFGTVHLPFALFDEGDGRGIENVCWGTAGDLEVRVFDYWYYDEHHDRDGTTTRSYRRFSCAVTALGAVRCLPTVIAPESLLTRLTDAIGFRDLQFESEDFNRAFQVSSSEDRFAYALVDPRMMEWLLAAGRGHRFEVAGDLVLVSTDRLDPTRLWDLLASARGFRVAVPSVLADLYPAREHELHGGLTDVVARLGVPRPGGPERDDGGILPKWTL